MLPQGETGEENTPNPTIYSQKKPQIHRQKLPTGFWRFADFQDLPSVFFLSNLDPRFF